MSTDEHDAEAHPGDEHDDHHAGLDDELDELDDLEDGDAHPAHRRRRLSLPQEVGLLLVLVLVLAIAIKAFLAQAFYIPSESMEPGLVKNDRILVERTSYWFGGSPERGDVVVFEDPDHWLDDDDDPAPTGISRALAVVGLYPSGGHLVKRVIGVAGDVVHCCDADGRLEINGVAVDESDFLAPDLPCDGPQVTSCSAEWTVGPIPDGELFVMGDNREYSADSSYHMCKPTETDCTKNPYVPVDLVVGKVFALVWPSSHARWIGTDDAFADVPDAAPAPGAGAVTDGD